MCGITGFSFSLASTETDATLIRMRDALVHRGPDAAGNYRDDRVALAHRRLSIIDQSGGAQPMATPDGQVVLSFNGEIYNFQDLKKELQAKYAFQTHSDTEVLLYAYREWGRDCLAKLNGMFAVAIYDKRTATLLLARDRMGKKPLYYSQDTQGHLYFASEPKALFAHPSVPKQLSPLGMAAYLQYEYLPVPLSIYANVYKLGAGEYVSYSLENKRLEKGRYGFLDFQEQHWEEEQAATQLRELLSGAVERRLMSDVPLGVFLSGGIDSSAVAALMCRYRDPGEIKTFSIAFSDPSFDESGYARQVAHTLGTDHHERLLTPQQLLDVLPEILVKLDEPFGDASLIPTYVLSRFTREQVTVALGGDGSDELFAGYPTFFPFQLLSAIRVPEWLNQQLLRLAEVLPVSDRNISFDFKVKQTLKGLSQAGYERMTTWLGAFSPSELAMLLQKEPQLYQPSYDYRNVFEYYQRMYLQEDILTKVDRASMMNSLEVRAPFLDPAVVAFANHLPPGLKLRRGQGKYLLKKALTGILPDNILNRPKKGFGIPVSRWFKNELKGDLLATLDQDKIKRQGLFRYPAIEQLLGDLFSGRKDTRKQLWTLYIFQKWYDKEFP